MFLEIILVVSSGLIISYNNPPKEERCAVIETSGTITRNDAGETVIKGTKIHSLNCLALAPMKDPFSLNPQSTIPSKVQ